MDHRDYPDSTVNVTNPRPKKEWDGLEEEEFPVATIKGAVMLQNTGRDDTRTPDETLCGEFGDGRVGWPQGGVASRC